MRCTARDGLRFAHTGGKEDNDQGEEIGPPLEQLESSGRGARKIKSLQTHFIQGKNVSATCLSSASLAGEAAARVYEQAGRKKTKKL